MGNRHSGDRNMRGMGEHGGRGGQEIDPRRGRGEDSRHMQGRGGRDEDVSRFGGYGGSYGREGGNFDRDEERHLRGGGWESRDRGYGEERLTQGSGSRDQGSRDFGGRGYGDQRFGERDIGDREMQGMSGRGYEGYGRRDIGDRGMHRDFDRDMDRERSMIGRSEYPGSGQGGYGGSTSSGSYGGSYGMGGYGGYGGSGGYGGQSGVGGYGMGGVPYGQTGQSSGRRVGEEGLTRPEQGWGERIGGRELGFDFDQRQGYGGTRGFGQGGYGQASMGQGGYGQSGYGQGSQGGYGFGNYGQQQQRGPHYGKGPKGWKRSDDRIREDVCETISRQGEIDASDVEIKVDGGVVTLTGTVGERLDKRRLEQLVEQCHGVDDVRNELRVKREQRNVGQQGIGQQNVGQQGVQQSGTSGPASQQGQNGRNVRM